MDTVMSGRVLVAEDEWITATALSRQLQSQGYHLVGLVGSGTAAVDSCRRECPDVVLMDIRMPEMDGITATRELMTTRPLPVVIVTGDASLKAQAEEAGAMAYVVKPVAPQALARTIAQARERFACYLEVREQAGSHAEGLAAWAVVRVALRAIVDRDGVSEPEAFDHLRQRAVASGRTLRDEAQRILDVPRPPLA